MHNNHHSQIGFEFFFQKIAVDGQFCFKCDQEVLPSADQILGKLLYFVSSFIDKEELS